MARSAKIGLDYFSHDTTMSNDLKVKIIEAKHGIIGYAIFNKLLERIYENGYFLQLNDDVNILFCSDNKIEIDVYMNVINDCINQDLFDNNIFNELQILTSVRIQRNYCDAVKRRKKVDFFEEILLLKSDDDNMNGLNVNINSLNVNTNSKNVNNGTQTKTKTKTKTNIKSKVKEKVKPQKVYPVKAQELSRYLFSKILENNPNAKEPNFNTWAKWIDLMMRADKRTEEQIKWIIDWSQQDSFWHVNILSTQKLRDKFDQLVAKAKQEYQPKQSKSDDIFDRWYKKIEEEEKQNAENNTENNAIIKSRV